MTDMTKRRAELADKRSKRQCSAGNPDLDRAISWYLRIGFEDGFDAGVAEMQAQVNKYKELHSIWIQHWNDMKQERDSLKAQVDDLKATEQVYQMNRRWIEDAKKQLKAKDAENKND